MSFDFAIACRGCGHPLRLLDAPAPLEADDSIQKCFACYPSLYCGRAECLNLAEHVCSSLPHGERGRNLIRIISKLFPQMVAEVKQYQRKCQMYLLSQEEVLNLGPGELGELFSLHGVSYEEESLLYITSALKYFLAPESKEATSSVLQLLKERCARAERDKEKEVLNTLVKRLERSMSALDLAQQRRGELESLQKIFSIERPFEGEKELNVCINQAFGLLLYLAIQVHFNHDDNDVLDEVSTFFEDQTALEHMDSGSAHSLEKVNIIFLERLSLLNLEKSFEATRGQLRHEMLRTNQKRNLEDHRQNSYHLSSLSSDFGAFTELQNKIKFYRSFRSINPDRYNYTLNLSLEALDEAPPTLSALKSLGGDYYYEPRHKSIKKRREVLDEVNEKNTRLVKAFGKNLERVDSRTSLLSHLADLESPTNKAKEALKGSLAPQVADKKVEDYYPLLAKEVSKLKEGASSEEWNEYSRTLKFICLRIEKEFNVFQHNAVIGAVEAKIQELQNSWDQRYPNVLLYKNDPGVENFGWSNLQKLVMSQLKKYQDEHRPSWKKAAITLLLNEILGREGNLPKRVQRSGLVVLGKITEWIKVFNKEIINNVEEYCVKAQNRRAAIETIYEINKTTAFTNAQMNTFSGYAPPESYSLTVLGSAIGDINLNLLLTRPLYTGNGPQSAVLLCREPTKVCQNNFAETVASLFFERNRTFSYEAMAERREIKRDKEAFLFGMGQTKYVRCSTWDSNKKAYVEGELRIDMPRTTRDPIEEKVFHTFVINGLTQFIQISKKRKLIGSPLGLVHVGAENSNEHPNARFERESLDQQWREKYTEKQLILRSPLKKIMEASNVAYVPPSSPPRFLSILPPEPTDDDDSLWEEEVQ
jgi:hypothetical protein